MNVQDLDLNLLRLFDAVYTRKKVSLAADALGISQPAASQGLGRLRALLDDPLFVRGPGGMRPTPRAERLASAVRNALDILQQALADTDAFDPALSQRVFRLQMMSDMGEDRYLPPLLAELQTVAPKITLHTETVPTTRLAQAMDNGQVDFAFGVFPRLTGTHRLTLFHDRYVVLLRKNHPFLKEAVDGRVALAKLQALEFAAVETHAHTLRMLKLLGIEHHLRLVAQHFMTLPSIIRSTNLGALVPRTTALGFNRHNEFAFVEPQDLPLRDFTVSLYWSRRHHEDPGVVWFRNLARRLLLK